MRSFTAFFEVVEDNNCPLYEEGECFRLTAKAFSPPDKKEACLILVREMTELLVVLLDSQQISEEHNQPKLYSCSGCTGLIKFRQVVDEAQENDMEQKELPLDPEKQELLDKIIDCQLFRTVSPENLKEVLEYFRQIKLMCGGILIRKGEPNLDLFIILDGELSVDDGPVHISTLGPGEICGEMSYLAGNVAAATVSAKVETRLVAISGEYFSRILDQSPSVQRFMAQLLAKRLAQSNIARSSDFDSCMHGQLRDMASAELFQIFHMHKKTGVLMLTIASRKAEVSFREGCIINAKYGRLTNQDAIYAILAEKEGVYSFRTGLSPQQMKAAEIGDFMSLLMEGVKRVDEELDLH